MIHPNAAAAFPQRLRQETSALHTALEALPVSTSITNPSVTKEEYIHYLDLMHDVLKDAERVVYPQMARFLPDTEQRLKAPALEKDLDFLGHSKTIYTRIFDAGPYTDGFAMGILYVLEGSSLGGRVILKNIKKKLGFDETAGASYFAGYGEETGTYWKRFSEGLAAFEEQEGNADEIIAGANYAFDAISKHFTKNGLK